MGPMSAATACRFYGHSGISGLLTPSYGNQCALIVDAHSPCRFELAGKTPDENECWLVFWAAGLAGGAGLVCIDCAVNQRPEAALETLHHQLPQLRRTRELL
jgi:hypothetical protein